MPLAVVLGVAVILIAVPWLIVSGRASQFFATRLARRFEGLAIRETPTDGDVQLVYHTYSGFFLWFSQMEHVVYGPADDVRALLKRLLRWNLTWGMLSAGLVFIPVLSLISYAGQLKSLRAQANGTTAASAFPSQTTPLPDEQPAVSLFHRVVGWVAGGLAVLSGVAIVVLLVQGEFEGAAGGVIVALLLGGVAKDWLRGRTN